MDKHRRMIASPLPRHRPPTKTAWEKTVTNSRLSAKSRDLTHEIDAAYIEQLFLRQRGKCAISGLPIEVADKYLSPTASLDRIESHRGYVQGNVQWVHKVVNIMKLNCDEAYFIAMCVQIAAHRGDGAELTAADRRALAGQKQTSRDKPLTDRGFSRFVSRKQQEEPSISVGGMLF